MVWQIGFRRDQTPGETVARCARSRATGCVFSREQHRSQTRHLSEEAAIELWIMYIRLPMPTLNSFGGARGNAPEEDPAAWRL